MSSERQETLRRLRPQEAHELIRHREMPMEQTIPWEAFEAARGNQVWGRYVYEDGGGVVAYGMFLVYEIVGQRFLWAKHGPVWFKEQSPEREAHLRELLQAEVRRRDKSVVFLRLAAAFSAPDLHPLLNSITYDHTYIADLSPRDPEAIAAATDRFWNGGPLPEIPQLKTQSALADSDEELLHKAMRTISYTSVDELCAVSDIEDLYYNLTHET